MKTSELVQKIKANSPALMNKIDDKAAAKVVRATLAEIGKQLAQVDAGALKLSGLGRFKVKQVEKEKDGAKQTARRVSFRVAKPADEEKKAKRKEKKAQAAAAAPAA